MRYNAFISYKHAPLDSEIAKKVHTGLETYRIPKSVRKRLNIKKIGRVFRDTEELPIGSNLTDNITEALRESECLIVICSPLTPGSEWVQKEIKTFISLHGREKVLAVLVEGEPGESFPELLLKDENGNPVEPLAADVRGETAGERNRRFKTEILRLIAPVIGCSFDDLRQRHRERIIRRTVSFVSAAAGVLAVAGIAFGLYHAGVAEKMTNLANEKAQLADEKTQLADEKTLLAEEILREYKLKQENQSRFLAKEAMNLFKAGERKDAALIAIAGLPGENNDRPYVAEAEYALSNILHAYDIGRDMTFDRTLRHDLSVTDEVLSADNTHLVSRDNGHNVYVWDTETWELCCKIPPETDKNNYLVSVRKILADKTGVYLVSEHSFSKYDFIGNRLYSCPIDAFVGKACIVPSAKSGFIFRNDSRISKVDLDAGIETDALELPAKGHLYSDLTVSKDERFLLFGYRKDGSEAADMGAFDLETGRFIFTELSEGALLAYCYTPSGKVAVASCNTDFITEGVKKLCLDLWDPVSGNILWSKEVPATINFVATFDTFMKAHSYTVEDRIFSEIVLAAEDEAFTYSESDGTSVSSVTLPSDAVSLDLRSDNAIGFIGMSDGNIETFDFHEGRIYSNNSVETGMALNQVIIMDRKLAVRPARSSSIYIMKYHTSEDLKEISSSVNYYTYPVTDPKGADHFIVRIGNDGKYSVISKDGKELATVSLPDNYSILEGFFDDKAVICSYDSLFYLDVKNGDVDEVTYKSLGIEKSMFNGCITENGRYAVFWDSRNLFAVDIACRALLFAGKVESTVGRAEITEDGSTLFYTATALNLSKIDVATGTETEYGNDLLRQISDSSKLQYISVSHDGKTLAMACLDGVLRLISTADGSVKAEMPFYAKSCCTLYFTEDDETLITQGDDLTVKILNLKTGSFLNSFEAAYGLKTPTRTADGHIALCDTVNMYLLETEHFGICACVPYGSVYIPSEKKFIIANAGHLYSVPYKDYKALIEEAKKQFPGAELTAEEKVKYNLD